MVCGPPPEGRARWTVRLVAEEVVKRGIATEIGRETARVTRISSLVELISLVSAWRRSAESTGRTIDWTFTVNDARRKFRYDGLVTARSRHQASSLLIHSIR